MPIILDESFNELDDTKFLRTLQFLLDSIAKHNQIIVLSSHHIRFHWLIQNLNDNQKRAIELCKRSLLRTEPVRG
jgi:ABC-type multidrug transport system ATPase subunit